MAKGKSFKTAVIIQCAACCLLIVGCRHMAVIFVRLLEWVAKDVVARRIRIVAGHELQPQLREVFQVDLQVYALN